jgi:hypothetical protein
VPSGQESVCGPDGGAEQGAARLIGESHHCRQSGRSIAVVGTGKPDRRNSMTTLRIAAPVLAAAALAASAGGEARADTSGCVLIAAPPTLYVDIVFASARVECPSPQNRIRVETVLSRDGVDVAQNTRDCHKVSICRNEVGSWAIDGAGDQVWCTSAAAWAGGRFLGTATACETEPF